MEIMWISWFPESGKIMEKIWNKCGKDMDTYRHKIWNTYRKIWNTFIKNMEYI